MTTTHPNQSEVSVVLVEAESPRVDGAKLLGVFNLEGIPQGKPGEARIEVTPASLNRSVCV